MLSRFPLRCWLGLRQALQLPFQRVYLFSLIALGRDINTPDQDTGFSSETILHSRRLDKVEINTSCGLGLEASERSGYCLRVYDQPVACDSLLPIVYTETTCAGVNPRYQGKVMPVTRAA